MFHRLTPEKSEFILYFTIRGYKSQRNEKGEKILFIRKELSKKSPFFLDKFPSIMYHKDDAT